MLILKADYTSVRYKVTYHFLFAGPQCSSLSSGLFRALLHLRTSAAAPVSAVMHCKAADAILPHLCLHTGHQNPLDRHLDTAPSQASEDATLVEAQLAEACGVPSFPQFSELHAHALFTAFQAVRQYCCTCAMSQRVSHATAIIRMLKALWINL